MARFAISDIHGCLNTFQALLEKIALTKNDTLYLLGDYIDRGKESKQVVDVILQLKQDGFNVECLLGNHEWLLLNAAYDKSYKDNWLGRNGGINTLDSYGIIEENYLDFIPEDHLKFFKRLTYITELEDFILVHAGINFKDDDPFSDYHSMIWIRDWYKHIDPDLLDNKKIIHGHTPRSIETLKKDAATAGTIVFDIDCGCVYKGKTFGGHLCALNMDTLEVTDQPNIEKY